MDINIKELSYDEAVEISNWTYEEPYSMYSFDGSDACRNEFLNGSCFSAVDEADRLIGYYCFGESARVPAGEQFGAYEDKDVLDIGLGMYPGLCGKRVGLNFFIKGIEYAEEKLSRKAFRLTVASFNKRAIKVYERAGFKKVSSFKRISEFGETEFDVMIRH